MIVVQIWMWPRGDKSKARLLSQGTIACTGQHAVDGDRAYDVRLFKDTEFRGPGPDADLNALPDAAVWRRGEVRGHFPGPRGAWDLLGGALQVVLGNRLGTYRRKDAP